MTTPSALLLSLRPRFAEAILNGSKTIEIRRRPVRAPAGTPLILYASSPTMAVVGTAVLADVLVLTPHTAWRRYRESLGVTWSEFMDYLEGAPAAHLLRVTDAKELDQPIPLQVLRRTTRFNPPQSFRYVAPTDPLQLRRLVSR
ncbi:ASCH domain-containing protein [Kribbella sp. NPDC023855]|uniref:ASCH domain-containing protein n=1 Tax=Kribbella sp. NPDC023855 TaxID=3154698 RepID=UPI0033FAFAC5